MFYSEEVFRIMYSEIDQLSEVCNIPKDTIVDMIYNWDNQKVTDFMETHLKGISSYSEIKAYDAIDLMHSYMNSVRFLVKDSAFYKNADASNLEGYCLEDAIFDFGKGFYCKISKCRYKADGIDEPVYKFDIVIKMPDDGICTYEMDFWVSKLPRLYTCKLVNNCVNDDCKSCGKCRVSNKAIEGKSYSNYILGKLKRESGNCSMCNAVKTLCGYSIDELFNACIYALGLYVNRSKRKVDKSENNGVRVCSKVHTPVKLGSKKSLSSFVTLREYVKSEKSVYKGGHHNSPVQHERRSHLRHLKNGKVIEVRSCTVNKGKNSATYVAK